jgi:3-oxoacyl-[acyl-carrier protein] reductase
MSAIDLSGRTALVTGSSRGIGLAIAATLLSAGAHVVLNARQDSNELAATAAALSKAHPGRVSAIAADISQAEDVKRLVRGAFDVAKRLDILVNNAGILRDGLIGMIPEADIQAILQTNLVGLIQTTQAASRLMARSKAASIVNIASIIGRTGNRGQLVYGASKAGVIGATLSAAKELAPQNIRVNAVAPGFIRTQMIEHLKPEIYAERMASIAMKRIGEPDDVANTVLFLASDLSTYVTGQVIGVDGGMVI